MLLVVMHVARTLPSLELEITAPRLMNPADQFAQHVNLVSG